MKENNYISEERKKQKKKKRKLFKGGKSGSSKSAVQIMNGDFLTRRFFVNNLNYIFFVVFLLILLVTKGYYVNHLANDIAKTEREVGDMMADYVEKKAALEEMTRRTELIEQLRPLGLKETINPTKVIRIKEKEK
ncbi:MAG: FtsL-like putative cell division protein [Bacteroidota bacterium]